MRRQIINYIFEIVIATSLIFMSIPFWNELERNKQVLDDTLAYSGLELSEDKNNYDDNLNVTTGSSNSKTYYVSNNSTVNTSGSLLFKYSKASLLNYKYLNITTNDYTTALSNLYYGEDDNYYIFLIANFNLNPNEKKEYDLSLDSDSNYYNETKGKSYIYQVEVNYNKNV